VVELGRRGGREEGIGEVTVSGDGYECVQCSCLRLFKMLQNWTVCVRPSGPRRQLGISFAAGCVNAIKKLKKKTLAIKTAKQKNSLADCGPLPRKCRVRGI
jgi:hypothetical protein